MKEKVNTLRRYGVWAVDVVAILISYLIATQLRYSNNNDWGDKQIHFALLVVFLLICTMYAFFSNGNKGFLKRGYFGEFAAVIKYSVILISVSLVFIFFAKWSLFLSRVVIINFIWMDFLITYLFHVLYKKILFKKFTQETMSSSMIVVSDHADIVKTINKLLSVKDSTFRIIGAAYIDKDEVTNEEKVKGIPVYSGKKDLHLNLTQIPFDEVFISASSLSETEASELITGFEKMGVVCHYELSVPKADAATRKVRELFGSEVATYAMVEYSYGKLLVKRIMDIAGGIVGLVLTGIISIVLVPAIKLDSPGPAFFSQTRVGKNGRRFKIWKFRSMYIDAEDRLNELMKNNKMSGLMFKMDNDPRITKVGAFIRKTSLDEFPQFWNVLKGDMSLVGTRPPTEREFEQYNEHYRRRLSMTPGLTGMWQVSGRSNIDDFDEVVRLDLQYIDNWGLMLDIKIICMTIVSVISGKGAG